MFHSCRIVEMKTTTENNTLTISRKGRNDQLFKRSGNSVVYCTDYGEGERSMTHHIHTYLGQDTNEKVRIIRQTLAYTKDHRLVDAVVKWFLASI